jgi:hypothetical protein
LFKKPGAAKGRGYHIWVKLLGVDWREEAGSIKIGVRREGSTFEAPVAGKMDRYFEP